MCVGGGEGVCFACSVQQITGSNSMDYKLLSIKPSKNMPHPVADPGQNLSVSNRKSYRLQKQEGVHVCWLTGWRRSWVSILQKALLRLRSIPWEGKKQVDLVKQQKKFVRVLKSKSDPRA